MKKVTWYEYEMPESNALVEIDANQEFMVSGGKGGCGHAKSAGGEILILICRAAEQAFEAELAKRFEQQMDRNRNRPR